MLGAVFPKFAKRVCHRDSYIYASVIQSRCEGCRLAAAVRSECSQRIRGRYPNPPALVNEELSNGWRMGCGRFTESA